MRFDRSPAQLFAAMVALSACTGAIGRGEGADRGHEGPDGGMTPGPGPGSGGSTGGGGTDAGRAPEDGGDRSVDTGAPKPPPIDSLTSIYPESVLCPAPSVSRPGLSAGFASTCAGCHGPTGDGQGPFPSLKNVPTVDEFVATVRNGRKLMPAFSEDAAPTQRLRSDYATLRGPTTPPPAADPDCGPGSLELPVSSERELRARIDKGMEIFRRVGPKGACAGCHAATATDLAFVGYSDANILRRAIPQIGAADAPILVDLVHALRQLNHVDRPLHPKRFRFLQPGHEVLPEQAQPNFSLGSGPGAHDAARDRAFGTYLRDEVKLLLAGDVIADLDRAKAAEKQLLELDLLRLRTGVPIERWTEDGFHGSEHNVPNEWIPMLSRRVMPGHEAEWQALVDAYRADPTDANLWRYYDAIESMTTPEGGYALAERWSLTKYKSVQVAAHMLLHRSIKTPDAFAGSTTGDPVARRKVAILHNPFWRTGDSVRQNPLNCNTNEPCTEFPASLDETMNTGDALRERMTYEDKVSWFWIGFTLDPALLTTDEPLPTVDGDYFLAVTQQHYNVHNAFVVATIITHKANAPKEYMTMKGVATSGHGIWASPRPFLAFKQSERELHHPPPADIRYAIHERIWANALRMSLYLMNDELARTGQVFDRARTLKNVEFMHHWFGSSLEAGRDHADLDAMVGELKQRLAGAQEIGPVTVTEPGDAPDPVVLP